MKHKLVIFGFFCFVYFACYFTGWTISLAYGEEIGGQKKIVLCFDDGPRPRILEKLLPVLEKYGVPGNFFVIGWAVPQNKELIKKMHDAGHEIENHSWGHENFKQLFKEKGAAGIKLNLTKATEAIFKATDRKPKFFRPPLWAINNEIEKIIVAEDYTVMKLDNPDINTEDYEDFVKKRPPEVLIERVKTLIANREARGKFKHVLVFHELPLTVEALKILIPYYQSRDYKFIHLDECKGEKPCSKKY